MKTVISHLRVHPRANGPRGYARGSDIAPPDARATLLSIVEQHWGLESRVLADLFLPDATADERDAFATFQRRSASKETAVASLKAVYDFDSTPYLPRITAPTLVLHRRGDRAIPFALGRDVAAQVPGSTFLELAGDDHFPWLGDALALAEPLLRFLGGGTPTATRPLSATQTALTAREREVLLLVSEGLTDAQIAEQLVLSTHTVHRHVANVRTKLGVPSRAAAAAWVLTHAE